nr:MAG TPA: IBV 3A protein [Caudoviricetes sp.]
MTIKIICDIIFKNKVQRLFLWHSEDAIEVGRNR